MKILIVSDTHRRDENLKKVMELEGPVDRVIHLGDVEEEPARIEQIVGCPLDIVSGNNDYMRSLPKEKEVTIGNYRILLTHGHFYYVSLDLRLLKQEAAARGYQIAMFGHTHRPVLEQEEGLTVLNPGSLSYPRQEGRRPSYMIMELSESGEARFEVRFLP